MIDKEKVLEDQLRECYGRVVYTHKTHEKCADILLERNNCIKWGQIILSAILTGGLVSILFDIPILLEYKKLSEFITAIISTILLVLNAYTKDYNLGAIAQKHRQAAAKIWIIRESYLSLLVDLKINDFPIQDIINRRDNLLKELHNIYISAPSTNFKAYEKAQKALKEMEEMTFSDKEIDKFLPNELKRT